MGIMYQDIFSRTRAHKGISMHSHITVPMLTIGLLSLVLHAAERPDASLKQLRRTPVVEVFEQTRDTVVNIACIQTVERSAGAGDLFEQFFDYQSPYQPRATKQKVTSVGSGFVVHPDGYVVTNAHVVLKSNDQRVLFVDGTECKAVPVAIDTSNDLAVLKIDIKRPLRALPLGRSDDLLIGETVITIGNPLGYHHTLTTGVISAVDRTLTFKEGIEYRGLIQTDASINPGNSGGPLLNILGELIGVNTAIRGDAQNIGFAIPVDALRKALPNMLSLERVKRVQVGMQVSGQPVVRVVEVVTGSPSAKAGITAGDRLLSVDGKTVSQDVDFYFDLLKKNAGDKVTIVLERNGKKHKADLILSAIPIPDGARLAREKFGLDVAPLPADLAQALRLEGGLIVNSVEAGSDAARRRVERGTIIVAIGGHFPSDMDQLGLLLEDVKGGDVVLFNMRRVERYGDTLVLRSLDLPLRAQ